VTNQPQILVGAMPCDHGHVNNPTKQNLLTEFVTALANVLIGLKIDLDLDMDCHPSDGIAQARRLSGAALRVLLAAVLAALALSAHAVGTVAGARIDSSAQMTFDIAGVAQTPITSNTTSVVVDEVLDAVVISQDAAPVAVAGGAIAAPLSFNVTNTGNGSEPMRLALDAAITGDDFNPTSASIYLESNGTPGLQIGAGGDTAYVAGTNDPVLARDTGVAVYVAANIPTGLPQGALGRVSLRAVPRTVFVATGTDDPTNAAFPVPGASFPGAGDPAPGGGNVTAVAGTTFAPAALRLLAQGTYRVSAGNVTLAKTVTSVTDPQGGNRFVPGAIVRYQISVSVAGSGTAQNLVVRDPVPANLAYVAGSLSVSSLPPGQQADDDFLPAGSDNTGFDGPNDSVVVTLGDVAGGGAPIVISFNTTIR
jgi:uncharacterized repeat protein (TIGR01451 family)